VDVPGAMLNGIILKFDALKKETEKSDNSSDQNEAFYEGRLGFG
jgi:hypothetical protein